MSWFSSEVMGAMVRAAGFRECVVGGSKKALAVTASCYRRRDVVALFAFYELPFGTLEACHAEPQR